MTPCEESNHRCDEALVAARLGNEAGFGVLYDELNQKLTSFAARRGATDPEETANAVLFSAFRGLATFEGGFAEFRSFVYKIARNRLIDDYRRRDRQLKTVPFDISHAAPTTGGFEDRVADTDLAEQMLAALTPDQREVLLLRVVADLSLAETASVMDKPVSAVKALQRRAVRALHRNLGDEAHS